MIASADIRHAIQSALCAQLFRRVTGAEPRSAHRPVRIDPSRDPDWAEREIVDDAMFEAPR